MHASSSYDDYITLHNITIRIYKTLFHQDHSANDFGAFCCHSRNTGASPFSFTISVLGSFTCITQHTGPTVLRPIRRTKQLWLSVLLKDTSAATGQDSNPHSDNTRTWVQCTRPLHWSCWCVHIKISLQKIFPVFCVCLQVRIVNTNRSEIATVLRIDTHHRQQTVQRMSPGRPCTVQYVWDTCRHRR